MYAGKDRAVEVRMQMAPAAQKPARDKWNNWVFRLSLSGWANGDSNFSTFNYNAGFSARQVKEKHKFSFGIHYSKGKKKYTYGDYVIRSQNESFNTYAVRVWGLNEHWSLAVKGGGGRSFYRNIRFETGARAGAEYNFYPYSQSSTHRLALQGWAGPHHYVYFEKTVFGKTQETLWQSTLRLVSTIVRKWGHVRMSVDYNQYLHHPDFRSFSMYSGLQLRLVKGLHFRLSGQYTIRHDQINIAAGDASLEEILLRQKELLSGYNFFASAGLTYSFGSIYNTIVNPRFDTSGG